MRETKIITFAIDGSILTKNFFIFNNKIKFLLIINKRLYQNIFGYFVKHLKNLTVCII